MLNFIAHCPSAGSVPIITYHSVDCSGSPISLSPDVFREQIAWLSGKGFKTLTLADYARKLISGTRTFPGRVVITFDDGFVSLLDNAVPTLEEFGYQATIFIPAGLAGRESDFSSGLKATLLNWKQAAFLAESGFEIASHSITHPRLGKIDPLRAAEEISGSREIIREELGLEVSTFCYPYGDWTPSVADMVRDAGYLAAVTLRPGNLNRLEDIFCLRRVVPSPHTTMRHFQLMLGSRYNTYLRWFSAPDEGNDKGYRMQDKMTMDSERKSEGR